MREGKFLELIQVAQKIIQDNNELLLSAVELEHWRTAAALKAFGGAIQDALNDFIYCSHEGVTQASAKIVEKRDKALAWKNINIESRNWNNVADRDSEIEGYQQILIVFGRWDDTEL